MHELNLFDVGILIVAIILLIILLKNRYLLNHKKSLDKTPREILKPYFYADKEDKLLLEKALTELDAYYKSQAPKRLTEVVKNLISELDNPIRDFTMINLRIKEVKEFINLQNGKE